MTSAVSATFQPISPATWHPNPGPPKPEATRANEQWAGEEGQAASLWGRRGPAARIQGTPGSGSGVWRGAGGGGRARRAAGVGSVGIRRRWSGSGELLATSRAGPTVSASSSSSSCCRRRPSARTGWTRRHRPLRRCRAGPAPSGWAGGCARPRLGARLPAAAVGAAARSTRMRTAAGSGTSSAGWPTTRTRWAGAGPGHRPDYEVPPAGPWARAPGSSFSVRAPRVPAEETPAARPPRGARATWAAAPKLRRAGGPSRARRAVPGRRSPGSCVSSQGKPA